MNYLKEFLVSPKKRCLLTLGVVCLGAYLIRHWANPWGRWVIDTPDFTEAFMLMHLPLILFLPLFITARNWVLTPVTISLAMSISTGAIAVVLPFITVIGDYRQFDLHLYILRFEGLFLLGWFFVSIFQARLYAQYGFSTNMPAVYVTFTFLGIFLLDLVFFLLPGIGLIYLYMAFTALQRVRQSGKPGKSG